MNSIPLSVAIITKNEEKNLSRCLESVCSQTIIVIVDSGSTDGTEQIARQFQCKMVYRKLERLRSPEEQRLDEMRA